MRDTALIISLCVRACVSHRPRLWVAKIVTVCLLSCCVIFFLLANQIRPRRLALHPSLPKEPPFLNIHFNPSFFLRGLKEIWIAAGIVKETLINAKNASLPTYNITLICCIKFSWAKAKPSMHSQTSRITMEKNTYQIIDSDGRN